MRGIAGKLVLAALFLATLWPVWAQNNELAVVNVAFSPSVDQVGLAIALNEGVFEKYGLDVRLTKPLPTGTEVLNALQSATADIGQVGPPVWGAALTGAEFKIIALYSGDATRARADDHFGMVAREGSGIKADDPGSLVGKRIGVSVGSANQLYTLGILERAGMAPDKVEMINTPPAELAVALQTGGLDAAATWEPWGSIIEDSVKNSYDVFRGGAYVPNQNYVIVREDFLRDKPEIVEKFMLARAEAQYWVRQHQAESAEALGQWFPSLRPQVIGKAFGYVQKMLDPRMSACTIHGMKEQLDFALTTRSETLPAGFKIENFVDASVITKIEREHPEYFSDLPPVPEAARLIPDGKSSPDIRAVCGLS
jgi:ABC-type nitrate/sulfonate/bicarbonate transport system substrate-binding protein